MRVYLKTERVLLREFTMEDVDLLAELDSDPAVTRYLTGGIATPRAVIAESLLPACLRYYDRADGYGFWAAIDQASGDFLGRFLFRPRAGCPPGEVELGYRLRQAAWGQGYATEVSRALIRKGFTELGVQRVVASTYQDNLGSRRVMEKCGLTLVRRYRLTEDDLLALNPHQSPDLDLWPGDDVEYALTRETWARQEAMGIAREQ